MRLIRGVGLLAVNISSSTLLFYDMVSIFCCYLSYGIFMALLHKKTPPDGEESVISGWLWLEKSIELQHAVQIVLRFQC